MRCELLVLVFVLFGAVEIGFAQDTYYDQKEKGWHWYHEEKPSKKRKPKQQLPSAVSAAEQLKQVQAVVEEAKAHAVLEPTPSNVMKYINIQNQVSENAERFSNVWKNVLLYNPSLNYRLKNPTNQVARHAFIDENKRQQNVALKKFAESTGLFYFYKGTCPYCQRFAPTLRSFSKDNAISVIPISLDGLILPEFPSTRLDAGQAARFHVDVTPALFTVNPETGKAIPVAYGMVSRDELRARILQIIQEGQ